MHEFWFCSECNSMNRSDAKRCYKCRAVREQSTLATVGERGDGVVLTPGLDEEHREVAWALMSANRYVSAWRLGYVAAGLMTVALAVWTFNTLLLVVYLGAGLISPERQATVDEFIANPTLAVILGVIGLSLPLSIILHSVFLALTSMNSMALGSGSPRFGPIRAGLWWIENSLWIFWGLLLLYMPIYLIAVVFVPVVLIASGGLILGTALAVLWLAFIRFLYGELGGPFVAIGKPRRLLADLMDRLGIPGASNSRLVGQWSVAWSTLVGTTYVIFWLPILLFVALLSMWLGAWLVGIKLTPLPVDQAQPYLTLLVVLVMAFLVLAYGALLYLTVRITIELSRRQRVREDWVRQGLPAAMANAAARPAYGAGGTPGQAAYEYIPPAALAGAVAGAPSPPARPDSQFQTVPIAAQSDGPAAPTVRKSWPAPIQFSSEALSADEPPRFDPRTWVPPRPVWSDQTPASPVATPGPVAPAPHVEVSTGGASAEATQPSAAPTEDPWDPGI